MRQRGSEDGLIPMIIIVIIGIAPVHHASTRTKGANLRRDAAREDDGVLNLVKWCVMTDLEVIWVLVQPG